MSSLRLYHKSGEFDYFCFSIDKKTFTSDKTKLVAIVSTTFLNFVQLPITFILPQNLKYRVNLKKSCCKTKINVLVEEE